ncbi:MAG: hypothetical protein ACRDK0_09895 [Solirubrobacteraceae bacterium]
MGAVRSDICAETPFFDACPIYSALWSTDLRSINESSRTKGLPDMQHKLGRTIAAVITATIASAAFASPASAGLVTKTATSCDDGALTQPFARWGDRASYKLVDDGGFEAGAAGWTLSGGAYVASGNESYDVGGSADSKSLVLPRGARAVSPFTCVGLNEPTLRLFAKRRSGLLTTLLVEIQVQTSLGLSVWLPVLPGDLGGGSWHPTVAMPLVANLLTLSSEDRTPVRFRFSPLLLGSWQIDDVYVDPARMR